ncbi:uncharacterized protein [Palaemon carinicauda]|uniref:uncharacterized protein n=1 Tax=Palaemon carinicauda TaxID=392227 RepID=UPI0035B5D7AD
MKSSVAIDSLETNIPTSKAGFLSDICFVKVVYTVENATRDLDLVVKLLPQNDEIVTFMKRGNLGEREVAFYERAGSEEFVKFCHASGLDHPVPEVYGSLLKDNSVTLVLDDLNAKGYRMHLLPEGNKLQEIKCTFKAIAVIHAFGYDAISKRGREYFHVPFDSSYLNDLVCLGLKMQIDMFKGSPLAEVLTSLVSKHKDMIATSQTHPLIETLVHGDLWAGNVMFTLDGKAASIYDWQFACIDNPLCDVTSMLLMSAEPSVYENHLNEVMEIYWKSFTGALMKNNVEIPITFTFESITRNLEKLWMHGFMFFTASLPDMMGNGKITEDRVRRVVSFLDTIDVFSLFLKDHKH